MICCTIANVVCLKKKRWYDAIDEGVFVGCVPIVSWGHVAHFKNDLQVCFEI